MDILRLGRDAGGQLRDVRLRALADAPYAGSSSLERESVLGPEFWDQRVVDCELGEAGVVFAAVDSGRAVGMAGGFSADGERQVAMLWGMWVDADARRSGLGRALVDVVLSWARDSGAARLQLAVTDCDAARPAETLYRMLGFQQTGELEPLESNPALIARVMSRSL